MTVSFVDIYSDLHSTRDQAMDLLLFSCPTSFYNRRKYSFYVIPNHYGFSTENNNNKIYTTQEMFGLGKNGSDSYDLINANLWNQMLFDPDNLVG